MRQTVLLPALARREKPAALARSLTNLASTEIDHNSAAIPWSLGLVHAMLTTQALASSPISGSCGRWYLSFNPICTPAASALSTQR
jgi:hypothetical protein